MLSYTRYPDLDFTYFVSTGYTTIDDWLKTVSQYSKEGMTTRELIDARMQSNLFTIEEIDRILEQTLSIQGSRPPNAQTAVVVNSQAMFGIARMFELKSEVEGVLEVTRVFYEPDEAIDWLGQDVAQCL